MPDALSEIGIEVADGIDIEVVEETAHKTYLTLPVPPAPDLVSHDELESMISDGQSGGVYTQYQPHSCSTGANCSC